MQKCRPPKLGAAADTPSAPATPVTIRQAGRAQDDKGMQQFLQWQQVEERLARENLPKEVMVDSGGAIFLLPRFCSHMRLPAVCLCALMSAAANLTAITQSA